LEPKKTIGIPDAVQSRQYNIPLIVIGGTADLAWYNLVSKSFGRDDGISSFFTLVTAFPSVAKEKNGRRFGLHGRCLPASSELSD
jgi:hypothetical protein